MIGLLVILVISWLLLRVIEKKNIDVLGIVPNKKRISQFVIGLIVITVIVLCNIAIETLVLDIRWKYIPVNFQTILNAFWYHLKSALTEDLVFRGALLYIIVQKLGAKWAICISAIVFGIYHWFSYGILGERLILLVYVFLITGFTGYVWAYTFYKTKSIMMGLGFHLGVNLINAFFFQSQPYGELLFQELSRVELRDWNWLFFNLFKGIFPSLITLICIRQDLKFTAKAHLKE